MMEINVSIENNYKFPILFSEKDIKSFAEKFLTYSIRELNLSDYSIMNDYSFDIMLCDNDFIHNINRDYRNIDAPTDIITFSLYADSEEKIVADGLILLGQIIISLDKVASQASENNVSEKYEFLNLLAHGVLHLLGIDHQDDENLNNMLSLQDKMIEDADYVQV